MEQACVRLDELGVQHSMMHKDSYLHQKEVTPLNRITVDLTTN